MKEEQSSDRFTELLDAFHHGKLSREGLEELNESFANEESRRSWVAASLIETSLSGNRAIVAFPTAQKKPIARRWIAAGLAAAIAVTIVTTATLRPMGRSLVLEAESGEVTVTREGRLLTEIAEVKLRPGDLVTTAAQSSAILRFSDQPTRLKMTEGGELHVVSFEEPGGMRFELKKGEVNFRVAPQSAGSPMIVESPHSSVEVLGTTFTARADETTSQIAVEEGEVLVSPLHNVGDPGRIVSELEQIEIDGGGMSSFRIATVEESLDWGLIGHWQAQSSPSPSVKSLLDEGVTASAKRVHLETTPHGFNAFHFPLGREAGDDAVIRSDLSDLPERFSLAFYFRLSGDSDGLQVLAANSAHGANTPGFRLRVHSYQKGVYPYELKRDGTLYLRMGTGHHPLAATSSPGVVKEDRWHHLVMTIDTARKRARFYLDGVDVTDQDRILSSIHRHETLSFGGMSGKDPHALAGGLADIRLYSRILTAEESTALAKLDL